MGKDITQSAPSGRRLLTAAKQPVDTISLVNVDIENPPASISGKTLVQGDRVLLANQPDSNDVGVYGFNGHELVRTVDFRSGDGQVVQVLSGTYSGKLFHYTGGSWSINQGSSSIANAAGIVAVSSLPFAVFPGLDGAAGDGAVLDDDAFDAVLARALSNERQHTRPGTDYPPIYSGGAVRLGGFRYKLARTHTFTIHGLRLIGSEGCEIFQDPTLPTPINILEFNEAQDIVITGVKFHGGKDQVKFSQTIQAPAMLVIENCEFSQCSGMAINTNYSGSGTYAGKLTIYASKFNGNNVSIDSRLDETNIDACHIWTPRSKGSPITNNVQIVNRTGHLSLTNTRCVSLLNTLLGSDVNARWVDNYAGAGSVKIKNTQFSGEVGGGQVICYWRSAVYPTAAPWAGGEFIVEDSYCATGVTGAGGSVDASVLYLHTGTPIRTSFQNLQGLSGPLIRDGGGLAAHMASMLGAYPLLSRIIRINTDVNLSIAQVGGESVTPPPMPELLVKYVNPVVSSPFPIGAQACVSEGNTGYFYYDLDLPSTFRGFIALLTISVNPNPGGSPTYRTAAVYLVHMFVNFYGAFYDVLSSPAEGTYPQPTLLHTTGASPYPAPTLVSAHFEPGGVNNNIRANSDGLPSTGVIRFRCYSGNAAASASQTISLTPIHLIT